MVGGKSSTVILMAALGVVAVACTRPGAGISTTTTTTSATSSTTSSSTSSPSTSTTTPTTTSTTTSTTVAPRGAAVVLNDGWVLGWWENGHWHADPAYKGLVGGESYQVFAISEPKSRAIGSAPGVACEFSVDHGLHVAFAEGGDGIAVFAPWSAVAGTIEEIEPEPAHTAAAVALLAERGVDDPDPTFDQLFRTDLDRDGMPEVLAVIGRNAGMLPPTIGDYSMSFVMSGNRVSVVTESVVTQIGPGDPPFYVAAQVFFDGVVDVNGDGVDEVAMSGGEWESWWAGLYEWDGGALNMVLVQGCGI